MKVDRIMERNVITCGPDDTLESAATLMWNHDCGAIPIVDGDRRALGFVTDRDIAMASALQHKPLWQIKTQEIGNDRQIYSCPVGTDAEEAVQVMGEHGVRRLLIVDEGGRVEGLLSIDDVICSADQGAEGDGLLGSEEVLSALKQVCRHQRHH